MEFDVEGFPDPLSTFFLVFHSSSVPASKRALPNSRAAEVLASSSASGDG